MRCAPVGGPTAYGTFPRKRRIKEDTRQARLAANLCRPSRNKSGKSIIVAFVTDRDNHAALLRDRAARLLAMALKAREDGDDQYAEELTQLASEAIDQAADIENCPAQVVEATSHSTQQTQQPQAADHRKQARKFGNEPDRGAH
jgi:hypothetical protein